MEENILASQKLIMTYSERANKIPDISHAYLFLMTHSHKTDQQVLELLVNKPYKYLGLLGSQHKIKVLKKNLKHKISEQKWQAIHTPIGLPIHSHTPMEIAISIAAELIQIK